MEKNTDKKIGLLPVLVIGIGGMVGNDILANAN